METHSEFLPAVLVRCWVCGEFGSNASPLLYRRRIQLRSGRTRTRTEPGEERTLAEETATSHAKP